MIARTLCEVLLVACLCATLASAFDLHLLHTGMVRGAVFSYTTTGAECYDRVLNDTSCFGGAHRRKKFVDDIRATDPDVILVDNGGFVGSTLLQRCL